MTLDQILADALAATTAAEGHPEPFKNDRNRTTEIIQALIIYSGLAELAVTLTAANLNLAAMNSNLVDLLAELELMRDAIHRA
jgi:hypothetical protein